MNFDWPGGDQVDGLKEPHLTTESLILELSNDTFPLLRFAPSNITVSGLSCPKSGHEAAGCAEVTGSFTRSSCSTVGHRKGPGSAASSPLSSAPAPVRGSSRSVGPFRLFAAIVVSGCYRVAAMVVYARRSWPPAACHAGVVAAFGGLVRLVPQGAWCRLPGESVYLSDATRLELLSVFDGVRTQRHGEELIGLYALGEVVRSSAMPSHSSSRLTHIEGGLAFERAQLFVA
jgi:hypothetical protein